MYQTAYDSVGYRYMCAASSSGEHLASRGVRPWTEDPMTNRTHLAIVRRGQYATYDLLTRAFAADPHVRVIWDRRMGSRRREEMEVDPERRTSDRRSISQSGWKGSDYLLLSVPPSAAAPSPNEAEPLALTAAIAEDVECAIRFDVPVLLTGGQPRERQTIAEFVHHRSTRGSGPFTIFAGQARDRGLIESLQSARNGTVFVPEIGAVSSDEQNNLLQYLAHQTSSDDDAGARVVTASEHDLLADIAAGTFSSQLFYHLNLIHVRLPEPLRR